MSENILTRDQVAEREPAIGHRVATPDKPYKFVVGLRKSESVSDSSSTKRRIYGPAFVEYTVYADGGVGVFVKSK